jgi:Fur family ferric uptake transcriptional regulator
MLRHGRTRETDGSPGAERLVDRMRARGVRITEQRRVIADLLEDAEDHLDADTVYRLASKRDPRIHRATVYRTLNRLKKLGLVDELDLMHVEGERHYYEIRPRSFHVHLVCLTCGRVDEPSGTFFEDLERRMLDEIGFRSEVARMEVGGRCTDCQGRASAERKR